MKTSEIRKLIYRFYQVFIFVCFIVIAIGEFGFVVINIMSKGNINDCFDVLFLAPLGVLTFGKMVYFALNRKKMSILMKILKSDDCKSVNEKENKLEEKWENFIR